jgi:hypothetical protein
VKRPERPAHLHERERALWDDEELLDSLLRGMEQASSGDLRDRGSFAEHGLG